MNGLRAIRADDLPAGGIIDPIRPIYKVVGLGESEGRDRFSLPRNVILANDQRIKRADKTADRSFVF